MKTLAGELADAREEIRRYRAVAREMFNVCSALPQISNDQIARWRIVLDGAPTSEVVSVNRDLERAMALAEAAVQK